MNLLHAGRISNTPTSCTCKHMNSTLTANHMHADHGFNHLDENKQDYFGLITAR